MTITFVGHRGGCLARVLAVGVSVKADDGTTVDPGAALVIDATVISARLPASHGVTGEFRQLVRSLTYV